MSLKLDVDLLNLLLSNDRIREHFFKELNQVLIFDKDKFINFIDNKEFLPNSYTAFKNKIGLSNKDNYIVKNKDIVLSWPYKDCILEGGQISDDEIRDEIFYNEILAPDEIDRLLDTKVLTNFKRIDKDGEHTVSEIDLHENMLIKGNNLTVLNTLKKNYSGKVNLIYVDPPYNPDSAANTFSYNNRFNHSTWLTFMKNRIEISKELLTDNGIFCVAIDHNELFYLGVLCDEIFGRNNRLGLIAVETNPGGRSDAKFFATSHEYFIVYAKNKEKAVIHDLKLDDNEIENRYRSEDSISKYNPVSLIRTGSNSTPDKRPNLFFPIFINPENKEISVRKNDGWVEILPIGGDNTRRVWRWSKDRIMCNLHNLEVKESNSKYSIYVKDRVKSGKKPKTMWYGGKYNASTHGTILLNQFDLKDDFSYPKSLYLMMDIITILSDEDSLILDFTAGSGTTAQAILQLNNEENSNRRFILCEQLDYVETVTYLRIQQVIEELGNSSFLYCELIEYNDSFIKKIENAEDTDELLSLWEDMKEKAFLSFKIEPNEIDENIDEFKDLSFEDKQRFLIEILEKNDLYVNLSEIEDSFYEISKEDIDINKKFNG